MPDDPAKPPHTIGVYDRPRMADKKFRILVAVIMSLVSLLISFAMFRWVF